MERAAPIGHPPPPEGQERGPARHEGRQPWWRSHVGMVALGFGALIAFYLLTEHTAHVFGALPYLLLLACPLMHLFMHHGGHGHGTRKDAP